MRPVPANTITKAVQKMLRDDVRLQPVAAIERSPLLNEDSSKCPWIGIYKDLTEFVPRTLGLGAGARYQRTQLVLVTQVSNATSGEEAEDELETLVANVLDIVFGDATLGGIVATITLAKAQYRLVQVQEDDFLQQAELYITAETTTR